MVAGDSWAKNHLRSATRQSPSGAQFASQRPKAGSTSECRSTGSRTSSQARRGPRNGVDTSDQVAGGDREFGARRSRGEEDVGCSVAEGKISSGGPSSGGSHSPKQKFLERAKKRLAVAETELQSAVQKKSQCEQEVAEGEADLARMREEVPVPADPDEDANVEVQRLKARLVQLESIHGRPPRGSVEAAENIRSKVAKRRCVTINGARSQLLVGRQTSGTPRCIGHGRHGVRRHNHWIDLKGTRQVGKFLSAPICSVEHGPMRRVVSRYGLRRVRVGEASHPGPSSRLRARGSRVRSRSRSGDVSRDTRVSPDSVVSVVPATIPPGSNILPTWPDSDSHGRCSAGSVPVDVLDALEEDLWSGARASAKEDRSRNTFSRSECRGTVIHVDTEDEQPLVRVRDAASARAISDEDPLFRLLEVSTVVDSSIPVSSTMPAESPLPTWHDGNQSPRCARDASLVTSDRDSEHALAVRASSNADAGRRMAVFARSSGRPKRLRVAGHFQRISQTTTVPALPERLRDMEFDMTRGDSSSDHIAEEGHNPLDEAGSDSETEAWWEGKRVVKTIMTPKSQFSPTITWLKCAVHTIVQWIVGDMQFW